MRLLLLLLVVAGCAPSARVGAGPGPEPWRKDWGAFWRAVEPYARAGKIEGSSHAIEINDVFGGEVEWTGTLRSVRASPGVGANVKLDMPPVLVPLRDGSSIQVRELEVSCSFREPGCEGWSPELVGKEVRFRTELINRTRGYRPVVEAEEVGKRRWVEIRTWGAELVGVVSR